MHVICAAALFDCDGVLVDSDASIRRSFVRWSAPHGIDGDELFEASRGRRSIDSIRAAAPHLDHALEDRRFEQLEVDDAHTVAALQGARELCTAANLRWAVVTSGARRLALARLAAAAIEPPSVVVTGDELTFGKPHPEGYLLAAARLGVAPRCCVVIEDADAGIAAGLAAGCHVIAVGPRATRRNDPRVTHVAGLDSFTISTPDASARVQVVHDVVESASVESRTWGDGCEAWGLLDSHDLLVAEEFMPAGTSETAHYHDTARQFFYVTSGVLAIGTPSDEQILRTGQGLRVDPGMPHTVRSLGPGPARFLAIAAPTTYGDRVEVEPEGDSSGHQSR
jgi:sugar-phosphatase